MYGKNGDYVESNLKDSLACLRSRNPNFKGKHIKKALQAWDDIIIPMIIYPAWCRDRYDFIKFNRENGLFSGCQ